MIQLYRAAASIFYVFSPAQSKRIGISLAKRPDLRLFTINHSFFRGNHLAPRSAQLSFCRSLSAGLATYTGQVDKQELLSQVTKDKFEIHCVRSGGPGGQNVNKTSSKAVLRLSLKQSDWIPESVKEKLFVQQKNSISKDGHLVVTSEKTRSQEKNIQDAIEKVCHMLERASFERQPPTEESLKKKEERKKELDELRIARKRNDSQRRRDRKVLY